MSFYAPQRRYASYQAYLADASTEIGTMVGGGTGAFEAGSPWRAITIGVTTGALTFLVTRVLDNMFPRRNRK